MGKLKITYVTLDPRNYPRIKKISSTLRAVDDIHYEVFIPKIRLIWYGNKIIRALIALINYFIILVQLFFTQSDVFWIANCPDILVLPLLVRRKRYVLEYRSPWPLDVEREFGPGPWVALSSFFEMLAIENSSIITLTTSKLFERVRGKAPVFVIPNYPTKDFGLEDITRGVIREKLGYSDDDLVILFVGKLSRVEGVDTLPGIMEGVLSSVKNAIFWIVGDGPLMPMLKKASKKFGCRRVRLFGWMPHDEVPKFIFSSDVCIAPLHEFAYSRYYNEEGMQKISEYMYFGKPIVASGIAESDEYLLVAEDEMVDGVLSALKGDVAPSRRRTWEQDSVRGLHDLIDAIWKSIF